MDLKAMAIVEAFNHMGCDAITVGEDDFLWGRENLLDILNKAEFPVVCANLVESESGKPLFQPYIVRDFEGLKVGIFGIFPEPNKAVKERLGGLTVLDPFAVAARMVSTLENMTDFNVLLSHLGYAKDLELARKVQGIRVIVGGHTGINLSYPRTVGETVVVQTTKNGYRLGKIDFKLNDLSRPFINVATKEMMTRRLSEVEARLEDLGTEDPAESAQARRSREMLELRKAETKKLLASYEGKNELLNEMVSLTDHIAHDPECGRILDPYLPRISEAKKKITPTPQEPRPDSVGEDAE